ncbi:putative ribosomal protein L32p [Arabidopsis thaliana]
MALRLTTLKRAAADFRRILESRCFSYVAAISPPLDSAIDRSTASPPLVLPEFYNYQDQSDSIIDENNFRFGFLSFSFGGSMELMAVPKKKISKHKRGIRNGPKSLKPTPVIIRCRSCGRVKLPHFYCCSGERAIPDEQSNSNN